MPSEQQEPFPEPRPKPSEGFLKYSTLAIQLLATLAVFGWFGYKLDGLLNMKYPVFLIVFVLGSFAGMIYQLYKSLQK
jgi:F0F1-type ATP synthase assembly protein I